MGSETFVEIILAILLPPVGVFLRYGCGVSISFLRLKYRHKHHRVMSTDIRHLSDIYICCKMCLCNANRLLPVDFVIYLIELVLGGLEIVMQVEFWIDLVLTLLGYVPGIIYAIYVLVG